MRYLVKGANRQTGEDSEVTIDAASESDAATRASSLGLMVSEIICVSQQAIAATPPLAPQVVVQQAAQTRQKSDGVALIFTWLIPGLGHFYKGKTAEGIIWLVVVTLGYFAFCIPGIVLHVICILRATSMDQKR